MIPPRVGQKKRIGQEFCSQSMGLKQEEREREKDPDREKDPGGGERR